MGQYDLVFMDGDRLTRRQRAAMFTVQEDLNVNFECMQGSKSTAVEDSGTTHSGLGVGDFWLPGMGDNDMTRKVTRKLRSVGCQAAFLRGPGKFGGYVWHWHICDLDKHGMDPNAQWQVDQYRLGFDGLSSGRKDPVPYRPDPIRKFNFDKWRKAEELRGDLRRLNDKIEDHRDTIESLQKDRSRLQRQRARLLNH